MQQQTAEQFDFAAMVADLNSLLRLKTTVTGIKMFARVEDMEAIPKIRRSSGRWKSWASSPPGWTSWVSIPRTLLEKTCLNPLFSWGPP